MNRRSLSQLAALALSTLLAGLVHAQSAKPVSLVVGFSPGGSADLTARVVAAEMSRHLGRTIIIENVPGAGGALAVQKVLNAPADGGYLYMGGTDTVAVPLVNPRVKHDWEKDFLPIGRMTLVPMVFAVPGDAPYATLAELFSAARKSGKDINYASPGIGTIQHFYGSLISHRAKVPMQHVPYKGGAQIAIDLAGRQIDSAVLVLSTALPMLRDGKIKALSVSDVTQLPLLANVKPIGQEEGFTGVSLPLWQGLFVKAGTPPDVAASYEKALMTALDQPDLRAKLLESGLVTAPLNGQALKAFVAPQAALYRDIVSSAKITMD